MKVISPAASAHCRKHAAGVCEHCRRPGFAQTGQVHHIAAKGFGGGRRLDKRINLVFLCPTCHRMVHDGNINRLALYAIVAEREHLASAEAVAEEVWRLQSTPKGS